MTEARLRRFCVLVEKWSPKINLVARADLANLWDRHVQDCLALVAHMPKNINRAIDLGSGAGFPGLVLAIATGVHFTLIESDTRKAAFLMEAARQTGAPAKIFNDRIERVKTEPAPLVTARALAPLDKLLGLAAGHLAPGGICLFPKGPGVEVELTAAKPFWHMQVQRFSSPAPAEGKCILKVSGLRHVGTDQAAP